MIPFRDEIEKAVKKIVLLCSPEEVYLFGSCARGVATLRSDIDLCVIVNTLDKRKLLQEIYLNLEGERDVDLVIYTPEEWLRFKDNPATLPYIIAHKGVKIYGRHQELSGMV